jgi:hypothetical protein
MTIYFYLTDYEQTNIAVFSNMVSNPFNVGDVISLCVNNITPKEIDEFSEDTKNEILEKINELENQFNFKSIKIIKETKQIDINFLQESEINIYYLCTFI